MKDEIITNNGKDGGFNWISNPRISVEALRRQSKLLIRFISTKYRDTNFYFEYSLSGSSKALKK